MKKIIQVCKVCIAVFLCITMLMPMNSIQSKAILQTKEATTYRDSFSKKDSNATRYEKEASSDTTSDRQADTIRVASFNIAAGKHPDIEKMNAQLREQEIDIVGVQEVDHFNSRNDFDMLKKFTDLGLFSSYKFQKSIAFGGGEYGVGILSKEDMKETSGGALKSEGISEARAWQRVLIEKDGQSIAVYNTHLTHENKTVRDHQMKEILSIMDKDPCKYKILTGDFNTDQSHKEVYPMLENYNITNGAKDVWFDTYNQVNANLKVKTIDNIVTTRNMRIRDVGMVESTLSDHNMFYAEFEFLEEMEPSRQLLDFIIKDSLEYDESEYTDDSYATLQVVIKEAQSLPKDVSQDDIDDALKGVQDAVKALKPRLDNLAYKKEVTVSGSEVEGMFDGSLAVDGEVSRSSRWSAAIQDEQWLQVDLGKVQLLNQVVLKIFAEAPVYAVYVSEDGQTFDNILDIEQGSQGEELNKIIDFETRPVRYIKYEQKKCWQHESGSYYGSSLYELEAYYDGSKRDGMDFISTEKRHIAMDKAMKYIPNTMEAWVKLDKDPNKRQVIFGNYKDANNTAFSLEITAENQFRYYEQTFEGGVKNTIDLKTSNSICTNDWVHVSVVRNPQDKSVTLLVNGKVGSEKTFTKLAEKPLIKDAHFVATDHRKTFFLDGEVSSIRLWNSTKTETAIKESMNIVLTGTEDDIFHAWEFDTKQLDSTRTVKDLVITEAIDAKAINFPDAPSETFEKEGTDFSKNTYKIAMNEVLKEAPLTFEAWIKMPKSASATRGGVIAGNYFRYYSDTIPLVNFEVYTNGAPRLYWRIDGKEYNYVAENVNVCTGQWVHVAISYDQQTNLVKTFINGEKKHQKEIVFTPKKLIQPLGVGLDGRPENSNMNFKGEIAELRVWSTTRSEKAIKENFTADIENMEGLLGSWKLDHAENAIFRDRSDHKNDIQATWFDGDLIAKAKDGYKSIAIIPDPQIMSLSHPEKFKGMTQWMVDQKETYGIELVVPMGDLVHQYEKLEQWKVAKDSMNLLNGKIPYIVIPGNHDTVKNSRDSKNFNTYFPYDTYAKEKTFGGAYEEGKMDNTYSFFTINGVDFMTLALETSPGEKVIKWANQVIADHPDKKVLIATHNYMYLDGKRTTAETEDQGDYGDTSHSGEDMWNQLVKKHRNIVMVLSGHIGYPDIVMREDKGVYGNSVQQVLCDAQWMEGEYGGLGMVMMFSFKEGSNDVQINWYSTVRKQFFRVKNQFHTKVDLTSSLATERDILKNALDKAEALMKHEDYQTLAPAVRGLIQTRYQEAKIIYEKESTMKECMDAWMKLAQALQFADFKADKTMLKTLIDECDHLDLSIYTEGVEALKQALQEAKSVYENQNVLQISIDQAYDSLLVAKNALKEKPSDSVDRSLLEYMIQMCEELNADQYVKNEQWSAYEKALADAKTVMADAHATQLMMDAATTALSNAFENIRLLPDEAALQELESFLNIIKEVQRTQYSVENVAMMDAAAKEASIMLSNNDFTKEEYARFQKKMASILHMIQNEKIDTSERSEEKKTPGSSNTEISAPATGEHTSMLVMWVMSLIGSFGMVSILKKKANQK